MSDRELLEMAAKAAGLNIIHPAGHDAERGLWVEGHQDEWNPLNDNGDAMVLACHLRLQIKTGKHKGDGCTVESQRAGIAGATAFYDDKAKQMRMAIVLVAAEIGKAMS